MSRTSQLVRTEREALIGLLETLTPAEWATPSLCGEWTVQAVAAHLAWAPVASYRQVLPALVSSGFRMNRMNADLAVRWADRGPEAILDQLRANAASGARPTGVPEDAGLEDAVVHGLDIRRPLGKPRPIPADVFATVAAFQIGARWPLNVSVGGSARKRIAGLRLVADDLDWSHGAGPEVLGPGEALMLMLTGRHVEPGELTGPGAQELYSRL